MSDHGPEHEFKLPQKTCHSVEAAVWDFISFIIKT